MTIDTQKTKLRERIYRIIDTEQDNPDTAAILFEGFITILIVLSIIAIIAESFIDNRYRDSLIEWSERMVNNRSYEVYFNYFENFTLIIFTTEYFLRIVTADYKYPKEKYWYLAAWRFIKSGSGIIDFVAISPFIFQLAKVDFRFLRALKISRLLRVLKLSTLTHSIIIVGDVFIEKRNELGITLFVTFVMLLISATLMWYVEGNVQPDAFPNIIATFWWAIATLTTVGYGDVFPITGWGKLLSGIIAVLGIGIVALPAGILSSAFIEKLEPKTAEAPDGEEPTETNEMPETPTAVEKPECSTLFGQKFKFCPYCGGALDKEGKHLNH